MFTNEWDLKPLVDLCWFSLDSCGCVFFPTRVDFIIYKPLPKKAVVGIRNLRIPCQLSRVSRAFQGGHGFSLWCFPLSIFSCSCCGCRSWRSWSWGRSREVSHQDFGHTFLGRESLYYPPQKTNMEPENEPLEEEIPTRNHHFRFHFSFRGVNHL